MFLIDEEQRHQVIAVLDEQLEVLRAMQRNLEAALDTAHAGAVATLALACDLEEGTKVLVDGHLHTVQSVTPSVSDIVDEVVVRTNGTVRKMPAHTVVEVIQ